MNFLRILTVALLSAAAFAHQFAWDPLTVLPKGEHKPDSAYQYTPDGVLHLFWERKAFPDNDVLYQVLLPNRTTVTRKVLDGRSKSRGFRFMSVQVSDDGEHVLLAYNGFLPGSADKRMQVFFTESFNGGKDWSDPIAIARDIVDKTERFYPSMILEKDTGRVHILYKRSIYDEEEEEYIHNLSLSIKEPGKKQFESEIILPDKANSNSFGFAQTTSRQNSKRYLHVFSRTMNVALDYSRSTDGGRTWKPFLTLASYITGAAKIQLAANSEIDEGGLYLYYADGMEGKVMWSKDHGNTFERPIRVKNMVDYSDKLALCGTNKKGILVMAHVHRIADRGRVRFLPLRGKSFVDLPYPFIKLRGIIDINYVTACRYMGNNEYSIVDIAGDYRGVFSYLAHGILKEN
eukprot:TRINITY_DN10754_c0_g3_i1.p1 TRINITY_DN10754_c0_g3~~TRINITY_DN10754_c0_g3_i1.p1  ORF type:complete len:404 (+),score=64.59 TRINITY_DN10754_c0_g3_i1:79-1290(+)